MRSMKNMTKSVNMYLIFIHVDNLSTMTESRIKEHVDHYWEIFKEEIERMKEMGYTVKMVPTTVSMDHCRFRRITINPPKHVP